MRWVATLVMTALACAPKSDSPPGDGTSAPVSGSTETSDASSESTGMTSSSTSSSTSNVTNDDMKLDVFEPDPVVEECVRENDLEGSVEIDTPIGGFTVASAFWGWNWCCESYPMVVLSEEHVLLIEGGPGSLPSDQPVFMAMIDPEGDPPWTGEAPSRFSAARATDYESTEWSRIATIVSVLEDPKTDMSMLEVAFASDGDGWRVEGSIIAEYCPALEAPPCPCE